MTGVHWTNWRVLFGANSHVRFGRFFRDSGGQCRPRSISEVGIEISVRADGFSCLEFAV